MKLEISNRKKMEKLTNTWKLHNRLLNNQWAKEEIKRGIRRYLETNKKENTAYKNIWYAARTVLRENFRVINAYIERKEIKRLK